MLRPHYPPLLLKFMLAAIPRAVVLGLFELNCDWLRIPKPKQSCIDIPTCKPIYRRKKINMSFAGQGSIRIVKNCALGLENAFSRSRSQVFTILTSQPANNI